MSISSRLLEKAFVLSGAARFSSPKSFYKKMRKNAVLQKKGEKIKSCFLGVKKEIAVYCGMRYFLFSPKETDASDVVMYLHGSGYMNAHPAAQERFAANIAKHTHLAVYFPIYPKIPLSTAVSSYAVLNNFYFFLLKKGDVLLAGDSSGGALALALASERKEADFVVAISPWTDLALDERADRMKEDVVLSPETLRRAARLWRYDLPLSDVRVSPTYGDYTGKKIYLFAAEKEIFCPYIREFYEKNRQSAEIFYREEAGQQHDYPLFPTPEGRAAREMIYDAISSAAYKRGER